MKKQVRSGLKPTMHGSAKSSRLGRVALIRPSASAAVRILILLERPQSADKRQRSPRDEATDPDFKRIRCPLCKWRPKPSHRWFCGPCDYPEFYADGCGACWNTFTTRGRCPGCQHQWRWTACLSCAGWSLHEDWYESKGAN